MGFFTEYYNPKKLIKKLIMGFGYQHRLHVTIEAGVDLVGADRNGLSDPVSFMIFNY